MLHRIFDCVKNGLNEEAKSTIQKLENIRDLTDTNRYTLLHYSIEYNNSEMTEHLIGAGCNVNAQNNCGVSPLMLATKAGDVKTVERLLQNNADIYLTRGNGEGSLELVFLALLHKSSCDISTQKLGIILGMFFRKINDDFLKGSLTEFLLNANNLAKLAVIIFGKVEITRFMLDNFSDMIYFKEPKMRCTALHCAMKFGRLENAKILIEYGANVNVLNGSGNSPLYNYTRAFEGVDKKSEVLSSFLRYSTNLSILRKGSYTDLERLLRHGKKKTVRTVLLSDINVNACLRGRGSLVSHLLENENVEVLDLVTEFKIKFDPEERCEDGTTTLMEIAFFGCPEKVEFLLCHGADVNATSKRGTTALMNALSRLTSNTGNAIEVVELLLQHGADVQSFFNNKSYLENTSSLSLKICIAHLAMLWAVDQSSLTNQTLRTIRSRPTFKTYFDLCTQQLEEIKHCQVHDTLTLFKLLCGTQGQIISYVHNPELLSSFSRKMKKLNHFEAYYLNTLQRKLHPAKLLVKIPLVIEALTGLCSDVYRAIVHQIISYLNRKDLNNLCELTLPSYKDI